MNKDLKSLVDDIKKLESIKNLKVFSKSELKNADPSTLPPMLRRQQIRYLNEKKER